MNTGCNMAVPTINNFAFKIRERIFSDQALGRDIPAAQVTSDAVAYDPNECMAARPMVCGAGSNWVLANGHFLAPSRHLLIRVHGHN